MLNSEKDIFNHLRELGCCEICSARYLCNKSIDLGDLHNYLQKNNIIDLVEDNSKKVKCNPCLVCLGLLQANAIEDILKDDKLKLALLYDSEVFTCSISMPACILLREHSMRLHLEEKFPDYFTKENKEIPLNRAWKMFVKHPLAKHLQKEFENSDTCEFSINICFDHEGDETELNSLKLMQPQTFKQRSTQRKKYGELFARKCVVSVLEETCDDTFKQHYVIPPSIATNFVHVKSIECKHNPVYFAGRYLKFSRELSQSPWIIDGARMLESSVQEIIFEQITKLFNISDKDMKFSASGREDCDVRCIGKGRPFYIEISDPKRHLNREDFKILEIAINESSSEIRVQYLQTVAKSDLVKIKEGEESKTKDYKALCKSKNPISLEQINKINQMGSSSFIIEQETPIRVLHRRPLATRSRMIHQMRAEPVEGYSYLFVLSVNTQAGTYVKEFVHGDFDRTCPNIANIIEDDVDIIALDVVSVNLNWPPEIND